MVRQPRVGYANNKASGCPWLWAHQRPEGCSKVACTSPLPQKSTKLNFHARRLAFQGTTSAITLIGDSTRQDASTYHFARMRVPRVSSCDRKRQKGRVSGSHPVASMPTFCLVAQLVVMRKGMKYAKTTYRVRATTWQQDSTAEDTY